MKKAITITGITLLSTGLIIGAAGHVFAGKGEFGCDRHEKWSHGDRHGGFGHMKYAMRHLDLSDDQKDEVKAIVENAKPKFSALHDEMKTYRQTLRDLTHSDNYDANQVSAAANDQAELLAQMMVLKAQTKADIYQLLTPEQQEKWREKSTKWKHLH